jgi:glutamine cyclotransferase
MRQLRILLIKGSLILVAAMFALAPFAAMPLISAENDINPNQSGSPHIYNYKIINIYNHDNTAFTQGLVYDDLNLYESTGLYGSSTLRQIDLKTGNIKKIYRISDKYFGEGITIWKDHLIQLTWKSNTGFVYDKANFSRIGDFYYPREGWGITNDGQQLIMSDGSDTLYFLNPITYKDTGSIKVKNDSTPIYGLNELEFIKGNVYANVYYTSRIAIISPHTGEIAGWVDLQALVEREKRLCNVGVLNGIAYDATRDRLFVTGKLWPELFEIEILAMNNSDGKS